MAKRKQAQDSVRSMRIAEAHSSHPQHETDQFCPGNMFRVT